MGAIAATTTTTRLAFHSEAVARPPSRGPMVSDGGAQELAGRRCHCRAPMAPSAQTTQMIPSTQARLSA